MPIKINNYSAAHYCGDIWFIDFVLLYHYACCLIRFQLLLRSSVTCFIETQMSQWRYTSVMFSAHC